MLLVDDGEPAPHRRHADDEVIFGEVAVLVVEFEPLWPVRRAFVVSVEQHPDASAATDGVEKQSGGT